MAGNVAGLPCGTPEKPDRRECGDTYFDELLRDEPWRIIVGRQKLQWIIQRRTGARSTAGPRWRSKHFCASQRALARDWPGSNRKLRKAIEGLPAHISL